jgi:hypothetical protein
MKITGAQGSIDDKLANRRRVIVAKRGAPMRSFAELVGLPDMRRCI